MSTKLDTQISNFLNRKYAAFPELAVTGRNEAHTSKYAQKLRASGQLMMDR
jgi:hypothetical protein